MGEGVDPGVAWYTRGRIYFVHRSCSASAVSGVESASLFDDFSTKGGRRF